MLRGGAHGGCFQDLEICQNKFAQGGGRQNMTWTCVCFLRFFTTSFDIRAVDRSVFCHISPGPAPPPPQSLSYNLRRHRSPSRHPARGCVSSFCVLRDQHLAIHRPVHFASPAVAGIVRYTASIRLAATSKRLLVGGGGAPGRPALW